MLHDASALIIEGCPIISFLYVAFFSVCQLGFEDIWVHSEPFCARQFVASRGIHVWHDALETAKPEGVVIRVAMHML